MRNGERYGGSDDSRAYAVHESVGARELVNEGPREEKTSLTHCLTS